MIEDNNKCITLLLVRINQKKIYLIDRGNRGLLRPEDLTSRTHGQEIED